MKHLFILRNLVLLLIFGMYSISIQAQEESSKPKKKSKTYLYLDYYKRTGNIKQLQTTVKAKIDKKFKLLENIPVIISWDSGDSIITLDTIITDIDGIAVYTINSNDSISPFEMGEYKYTAEFEGNKSFKPKKKTIRVKDLILSVKLEQIDSISTISVKAEEILNDSIHPVNDLDITFYVERMFSLLEIGEESTNNGKLTFEFPNDIPGDSIGNLTIFTKVEDDRDFGNYEDKQIMNWGIAVLDKESYKRSFSGGNYIIFMIFSLLIAGLIIVIFSIRNKK